MRMRARMRIFSGLRCPAVANKKGLAMKTSFPSLKVDPELRTAVENVLETGETLASFMEQSLRLNLERRQHQRDFVARALASRESAKRTGEYYSATEVLNELDSMLSDAEAKAGK